MQLTRHHGPLRLGAREIINPAPLVSFAAIALDEFLRTPLTRLAAQPALLAQHWVTASLMMIPLFAAGIWAGCGIVSHLERRPPERR